MFLCSQKERRRLDTEKANEKGISFTSGTRQTEKHPGNTFKTQFENQHRQRPV